MLKQSLYISWTISINPLIETHALVLILIVFFKLEVVFSSDQFLSKAYI